MKTLDEFKLNASVEEIENSSTEEQTLAKGTPDNPFTVAELEETLATDSWQGGYVESIGVVAADTDPSNFDEGYGYSSGFDYDIADYTGDNQHRAGTIDAFANNETTCAYISINHFIKLGNENVADLYNDWLIYQKKQETGKETLSSYDLDIIRRRVAGGMTETDISYFLRDILPNFGLSSISTKDESTMKKYLTLGVNSSTEDKEKIRAIGIVAHYDLGSGVYHAIKIKYIDGNTLEYVDPNTNSTIKYYMIIRILMQ